MQAWMQWSMNILIAIWMGVPIGIVVHYVIAQLMGWNFNEQMGWWE